MVREIVFAAVIIFCVNALVDVFFKSLSVHGYSEFNDIDSNEESSDLRKVDVVGGCMNCLIHAVEVGYVDVADENTVTYWM